MDKAKKELCQAWAREKNRPLNGFPRKSVLARVKDEGSGASIRAWVKDYVPQVQFMTPSSRRIESAWRKMSEIEARVFALRWLAKGRPEEKWEALGISKAAFYRHLDSAMKQVPLY